MEGNIHPQFPGLDLHSFPQMSHDLASPAHKHDGIRDLRVEILKPIICPESACVAIVSCKIQTRDFFFLTRIQNPNVLFGFWILYFVFFLLGTDFHKIHMLNHWVILPAEIGCHFPCPGSCFYLWVLGVVKKNQPKFQRIALQAPTQSGVAHESKPSCLSSS